MSEIKIAPYTPPVKGNPYTEHVAALIEAEKTWPDENSKPSTQLVVPVGDVGKTKLKFAKAANDAGKTARINIDKENVIVGKDGKEVGDVTLTFYLTEKHKPRTRKNKAAEADSESESE